jgi:hypothetical protein
MDVTLLYPAVPLRARFNLGITTPDFCFWIATVANNPLAVPRHLADRTSELVFNVLWSYVEVWPFLHVIISII